MFRPDPDITVMVDWALKIDYLSNNGGYPGGDGKSSVCYFIFLNGDLGPFRASKKLI